MSREHDSTSFSGQTTKREGEQTLFKTTFFEEKSKKGTTRWGADEDDDL